MSAVAAVIQKYEALTAANFPGGVRPPIFFGGVPVVSGTSSTELPWVNLVHKGTRVETGLGPDPILVCRFILGAYAITLADVEAIARAIRWNGQAPSQCAGFDFAASITVAGYTYMPYSCQPDGDEIEGREKELSKDQRFVHTTTLPYRLQYQLTSAYPQS